jgi:TolB-like protein/DNA-binding winged helix-turn-helix (wHTH) protein/Flp pilus assembly protein TadD
VPLPPKVIETLVVLLEQHGCIVEKEELLSRLWPDTFVEEGNVLRNVSTLRKALGDGEQGSHYIETIPKRGYRFIAKVEVISARAAAKTTELASEEVARHAPAPARVARSIRTTAMVVVAALSLGAALLLWQREGPGPPPVSASRLTLAVLPFQNLTGDPAQEYLTDGLTEELITQLSQIERGRLAVIARSSIMKYKTNSKDAAKVSRELRADYLLEGSMRMENGQVRINAQLIDARDQTHRWAQSYDRSLRGIVAMQQDVAGAIAREIQSELTGFAHALQRRNTTNQDAYDSYLKGRFHWNKRTEEGLNKGLGFFKAAVQTDPGFAPAYAGIADSFNMLVNHGLMAPADGFPRSMAAAQKALALDETLAEAHAALAFARFEFEYAWADAEKSFRRAIELNPSYSAAHQWHSRFLVAMGRFEEARIAGLRARDLDPLSPTPRINLGFIEYHARNYDQAIREVQHVLELDPAHPWAHIYMALAYSAKGMHKEALAAAEKAAPLAQGRPSFLVAYCYAAEGRKSEAQQLLSYWVNRRKTEHVDPVFLAGIFAALGEKDKAFHMLEAGYTERSWLLPNVRVFPWLDSLRSDPRFQSLLRKMNFPSS